MMTNKVLGDGVGCTLREPLKKSSLGLVEFLGRANNPIANWVECTLRETLDQSTAGFAGVLMREKKVIGDGVG